MLVSLKGTSVTKPLCFALIIGVACILGVPTLIYILLGLLSVAWFLYGLSNSLYHERRYIPQSVQYTSGVAFRELLSKHLNDKEVVDEHKDGIHISHSLDSAIQHLMDLVVRDYFNSWYDELGYTPRETSRQIVTDLWLTIEEFAVRLSKIDHSKFVAKDVVSCVTEHLKRIGEVQQARYVDREAKLPVYSWLTSHDREQEFLRKDVMLIHLLPVNYARSSVCRRLLREILCVSVLKPAVDIITDPHYINNKLVSWLTYKERMIEHHKRSYQLAATYEDFMKMIDSSYNLEDLKHMRYSIISEIMQATTIQNWKRSVGEQVERPSAHPDTHSNTAKPQNKGDLLRSRNLKRYCNQLTVAKIHCERRIYVLGGPDYKSYTDDTRRQETANMKGKRVLSYTVVMETAEGRKCFLEYLSRLETDSLLRFYSAIEQMENVPKHRWHQMGNDIYHSYVAKPKSVVKRALMKEHIKNMEQFLLGNIGADAYIEAKDYISRLLEQQYYPSFIVSDLFHKFMNTVGSVMGQKQDDDLAAATGCSTSVDKSDQKYREDANASQLSVHSLYAEEKLKELDDRILNKSRALQAMRANSRTDAKMVKLQDDMEQQLEVFKQQRREIEFHIDRTHVWLENIGKWKCCIPNFEEVMESGKSVHYFVVILHLTGVALPLNTPNATQGWVVSRKMSEFYALQRSVEQINGTFSADMLPRSRLLFSPNVTDKISRQLESFLSSVLRDESLASSEVVFSFFSPSPDHLRAQPEVKKSRSSLFTRGPVTSEEDQLMPDTEDDLTSDDDTAEPFYELVGEIFELRGVFKFLRRTMMAFVQVTFGKSITRQLRETIAWIVSEPMLVYYINLFTDSYWPKGELAAALAPATDAEKLHMRRLAKQKLLNNMPNALINLVGESAARRGVIKLFESTQDSTLNKQLFYSLLQLFLYEAFPELHIDREGLLAAQILRPQSPSPHARQRTQRS